MYTKKYDAKFYAFEDDALRKVVNISKRDNYLNELEIKELIQRVSGSFKLQPPHLKYTRKDSRYCYYQHSNNTIYLNPLFGCTSIIVLHEMCHYISDMLNEFPHEVHGKEYCTIWIDVMSKMFDVDKSQFELIADNWKIVYTPSEKTVSTYKPKY